MRDPTMNDPVRTSALGVTGMEDGIEQILLTD